jgi:hypothetical protein
MGGGKAWNTAASVAEGVATFVRTRLEFFWGRAF